MAFNYERIRRKRAGHGNEWSSYSDLFMAMAFLFLMLYVSTSLRSGTQAAHQAIRIAESEREIEDMRGQMKAYDSLKREYLEQGASVEEKRLYEGLMSKLTLLQDEATREKNELERQAKENADKANALNHYQRAIRNIINANMVAQARIKSREDIISKKEGEIEVLGKTIEEKSSTIADLESEVRERELAIAKNNEQIAEIEGNLQNKIAQLEDAHKNAAVSKKRMHETIAKLRQESQKRITALRTENNQVSSQLANSAAKLADAERLAAEKSAENSQLAQKLLRTQRNFEKRIQELEQGHRAKQEADRKNFLASLAKEKLSAEGRLARERDFRKKVEAENMAYDRKVAGLKDSLGSTKRELAQVATQKSKLAEETQRLQGDLVRAKSIANYKRELANRIRKSLADAGVEANVDPKTGDVTLTFAQEYFDTNEAKLKTGMRSIIEKFIPIYAQALFSDPKIADEIRSVELIGFASPTYQKRYVDPSSLKSGDRKAVNYNLDLSYQRAKSIFQFIFDTDRIRYPYQDKMVSLVKVTGRSYLASKRKLGERSIASMNADEFCKQYNCLESQKVIIKFNLEE